MTSGGESGQGWPQPRTQSDGKPDKGAVSSCSLSLFLRTWILKKGTSQLLYLVLYRLSTPWIEDCRTAPLFDGTEKDHCDLRAMPVRQPGMWYLERENSDGRIKRREFLGLLAGAGRRQHMSRHLLLISLIVSLICSMGSAVARPPCDPRRGDTSVKSVQALNVLKTRTNIPRSKNINLDITLAALIKRGNDRGRWDSKMAATIVGYVAKVGVGGIESVNCHAKDAAHRDTHIDMVVSKKDAKNTKKHVIVEVTPQFRSRHPAWTTANLRKSLLGRCVKITGWIFFDAEHANASVNTAPSNRKSWRATAWEVHPITDIKPHACPR